jgi:hypothetical protein
MLVGRRMRALPLCVLFAGLIGCGRDQGSQRSTARATSSQGVTATPARQPASTQRRSRLQPRQRFTQQANGICARLIPKAEKTRQRYFFQSDASLQQRGFAELAHEVTVALSDMRNLRLPARGQQDIRRIEAAAAAGVAQLEQATKDPKVARRVMAGVDPFARTAALARAYGLTSCQATAGIWPGPLRR